MDRQLKAEIVATVKRSVAEAMEVYSERWITDKEMSQYISVMTQRWLRDHGDMLPRQQPTWKDKNGVEHSTSYLYPLHQIQAMMADGRIKELREKNIG
jgi:hypothetical protein